MEQRLSMLQSLEPQRRLAAHLRGDVGRPRFRIPDHRHHHRTRLPTRQRRKRGTQNQAIGRSRGGVTTKIHLAVRGTRLLGPLAPHGWPSRRWLGRLPPCSMAPRPSLSSPTPLTTPTTFATPSHKKRAEPVIPNNPSRARKHPPMLLQQAQALPSCRHALRENSPELPRGRHHRRRNPMAPVNVHRT